MQKILFGIFAHPDDEAFGPAGTLLKETAEGTELHLITLTSGENGTNPDDLDNLGEIRLAEWQEAGKLFGATSMEHLGYTDGTLCNKDHQKIASQIEEIVNSVVSGRDDLEIEFLGLDLNGFTGHIDHIVASRSACLAFYRLREQGLRMKQVRLFCWPIDRQESVDTNFVYMEPGHKQDEIDETIDAEQYLDEIKQVMRVHHTQRKDCEWILSKCGDGIAVNHFVIRD